VFLMKPLLRLIPGTAVLLSLPAAVLAAPAAVTTTHTTNPLQLDAGSLGLLGAGLVALAISQKLRRRS